MNDLLNEISRLDCSDNIKKQIESLCFIYNLVTMQRETLSSSLTCEDHNEKRVKILGIVRQLSAEVYSWCDITNELFISLYRDDIRYRGSCLSNGFNSNFKKIFKAHQEKRSLSGIHDNSDIKRFYYESKEWFIVFHDIRTQETHYEVGTVDLSDGKYSYWNSNRNGVSKSLYSNPSKTIEFDLNSFVSYVDRFIEYSEKLVDIVTTSLMVYSVNSIT